MIVGHSLKDFRAEFAVAHTSANFHFWPDCCDCPDDFSALSHCDAVAARNVVPLADPKAVVSNAVGPSGNQQTDSCPRIHE
jgi:hypothetical protein